IDIRMPKMNGFELYREIKKKNDSKAKICFFTAFEVYYDEFRKMFPSLEVKCFIRKPITISDLVTHINSELERK
ncbi:MAG TPA: response regulator, partial [Candidatus Nitrosotalea sp.]|nr:response regulator [Candidatus Nitrosotalea sp.]